ncbi:DUF4625 domain-containing protein [Porifericola rhodea]|uniref:DUF4625 domain-containing protein n=1 Tax=Porifericola rhodea TaxID=930972 RepID=UPI0026655D2A|nr:DUF4625 domain-containing protein [Porifericola rhodea]WKN31169.1 DUF4625 domain-containing protein [Porifericola rhodea]
MKKLSNLLIYSLLSSSILLFSCEEREDIDTEYPTIDISYSDAFPRQCSSIKKGSSITFKALFRDNVQLGSYSIDIHHNFDHHSHSTEVNDCDMDAKKEANNPFLFIKNYDIPEGQQEFVAEQEIEIPADIESGDYHFMILLTDEEGWQTIKGLSIKIE